MALWFHLMAALHRLGIIFASCEWVLDQSVQGALLFGIFGLTVELLKVGADSAGVATRCRL